MKPVTQDGSRLTSHSSIPDLPGLDLNTSLHRVGNNWALLQKALLMFATKNQDCFSQLMMAISTKDWQTAIHITHAIKGSSATIGAGALAEVSRKIESLLKAEQYSEAELSYAHFQAALNQVLENIHQLENEPLMSAATHSSAQLNQHQYKETLLKIIGDLSLSMLSDLHKADIHMNQLISVYKPSSDNDSFLIDLKKQYDSFNFLKARTLLDDFSSKITTDREFK